MTTPGPRTEAAELLAALGLPADATADQIREAAERVRALADQPNQDDDGTYADPERVDAGTPVPASPAHPAGRPSRPRRKSPLRLLAAGALVLGMAWAVYTLGDTSGLPEGHPSVSESTAAVQATLDEAKVAELTARIEGDPGDAASLRALAEEYFRVGRYAESATWQAKIVAQKPDDVDARLILGVAYFNDGQLDAAEEHWTKAADLAPTSPDPWYNLGFLFLSRNPPDYGRVESAWRKVIELAPDSDIARTAQNHLERLASPSPTPTK